MLEKRSSHIDKLAAEEPAIKRQFVATNLELSTADDDARDPLLEDEYEVVRGMIHKYGNRVLCLLTLECAAYCRFCTRRRVVSDVRAGTVSEGDIVRWADYLSSHHEVKEAILSGGDPMVASDSIFSFALKKLSAVTNINVIRIGTRVPVSDPTFVTDAKCKAIRSLRQPVYMGIHFEHPSELTPETIDAVTALRKAGAILYSQSVFLAGVNDDYDTLYELFSRLIEVGVRPYYLYRCDPVEGTSHFRVDFEKERRIMTALRRNLSGLACPTYIIDAPQGSGKVPVPLCFWKGDFSTYQDFDGAEHRVEQSGNQTDCRCSCDRE